jgi:hypothetical protein
VAVIEVVLSRRAERRWRILAQTGLMELGEAANVEIAVVGTAKYMTNYESAHRGANNSF